MSQGPVFLIGGGWTESAFSQTYGRFVAAIDDPNPTIACVLLDQEDREAYFARSEAAIAAVGVAKLVPIFVSSRRPLEDRDLTDVSALLVGGGLTPAYHDAIVASAGAAIISLVESGRPYAGFSAGAMIAPNVGIVGGWKRRAIGVDVEICSEDVSEDCEYLDVRPGIGLVPFAVDVHASQYGTPTRLLHAVQSGAVVGGWAIDEDTMLALHHGRITVSGRGSAYRVIPDGESLAVKIFGHGDAVDASVG